jgi:hypothetical protein
MWLALAALIHPASAATCDAKALTKALTDALPNQSAKAYADLAACDATAAQKASADAFKKILPGEGGDAAVLTAIGVNAGDVVRAWVNSQEPDDRSRTISKLGEKCAQAGVPAFFLDTQKQLGDKFWSERWYRGLDDCRDPSIQELLKTRIATPGGDRTLFFGIVEVFSRNLGKDAIPALKTSLQAEKDPEISTYLVNAFADAAGVGSANGANPDAVKAAVAAIVELAPTLPEKAVDQARVTLLALGSEADSDKMVAVRHKAVAQANGTLLYGAVSTEAATCKKGDTRVVIHTGQITDSGHTWPDQLAERIKSPLETAWEFELAEQCKGTGTVETATPMTPFKDAAAYQAWVDATIKDIQKKYPDVKIKVEPEEMVKL